jgi:hypothetical protein
VLDLKVIDWLRFLVSTFGDLRSNTLLCSGFSQMSAIDSLTYAFSGCSKWQCFLLIAIYNRNAVCRIFSFDGASK